jgi:dipeptide/tripeptide permease
MDVMGLSVSDASIQTSLFIGTAYLTPLLGAWLADGYWGRYKTIMAFSILYAVV